MSIKKLTKESLANLVDSLIKSEKVIGVQAKGDRFHFAPLTSAKDLRLDYDVTLQPPKTFFQPPVETLVTFEVKDGYKSQHACESFILLGVHPYDMIAINQMDKLFARMNMIRTIWHGARPRRSSRAMWQAVEECVCVVDGNGHSEKTAMIFF